MKKATGAVRSVSEDSLKDAVVPAPSLEVRITQFEISYYENSVSHIISILSKILLSVPLAKSHHFKISAGYCSSSRLH